MGKTKASIVSEAILLIVGTYFMYNALFVLKWQKQWYRSGSLFPIIASAVLIVAALVGLYQDLYGVNKGSTAVIKIGDLKRMPMILGIMVAELVLWQVAGFFYASMFIGTSAMIAMMNVVEKNWKTRALMAVSISAVFIGFVYLIFDIVCRISL